MKGNQTQLMNVPNFSYQSISIFRLNEGYYHTIKNAEERALNKAYGEGFDFEMNSFHKKKKKKYHPINLMRQRSKAFNECLETIDYINSQKKKKILLHRFVKQGNIKIQLNRVKGRHIIKHEGHIEYKKGFKDLTITIPCTIIKTSFVAYLKQIPDILTTKIYDHSVPGEIKMKELGYKFNVSEELIKLMEDEMTEVTNCDEDTYLDSWVKRLLSNEA